MEHLLFDTQAQLGVSRMVGDNHLVARVQLRHQMDDLKAAKAQVQQQVKDL